jgi:hypothetical protein
MPIDIDFMPAISKVVAPQDLAMDDFRKQFKLVAGCEVSADGKMMTYQLKSMWGAQEWLSAANSIIIASNQPLVAKIRSVMKGKELVGVELRIVYTPK